MTHAAFRITARLLTHAARQGHAFAARRLAILRAAQREATPAEGFALLQETAASTYRGAGVTTDQLAEDLVLTLQRIQRKLDYTHDETALGSR